ncbi:glycoside hydrolase 43 family protein [Clostridium estertheticum]|uniref:glycoside hydrolase family 43 protein n=1 Tax=Clostridium estertheticum TaxID=238834 RepID=UPI001CF11F3E|nr:glycoside hydrolase 43 family protein [Clostridium estertheticum]MCB2307044.1 glycoside hydrolase 43 family protein [Clostridium estertheticum]MCB2345852.1 glycoside hydrolase 43 family protein [Clostridium estertheticum]MCB2350556.1 glycoside hydrolase 43 family protein [Clostridium estertheticum]WAG45464.1 glycoside hydrolase 43 family protein [Clostridium estertheticum]
MKNNPIIWSDYPDIDVIRVEDTYYMVSTTMHFMPGCVILRSYDLIHWEVATHVYEVLEDTPAQKLQGEEQIYGRGMWAASLRYYNEKFYVCFVSNDTHKTYLFTASDINGPWKKQIIEGFYHDSSLLFDEDGRIYIIYGNTEIYITELNSDLTGPRLGGLNRIIVKDTQPHHLGYEGSHIYKINGKYYVFFIHMLKSKDRRTEACFVADSLEGEFTGGEVFDDDMGYHNSGVAQGGIVNTPDGKWYSILFQDHGAVGRIPVIIPLHLENDFFVFDKKAPEYIEVTSTRPGYEYKMLVGDDDFIYEPDEKGKVHLKDFWQWNHIPTEALWSVTEKPGTYRIHSGKSCPNLLYAVNTLTQRTMGPDCEAVVTLDGSELKDGDYAGLCLLISSYGFIALTKEDDQSYLVMCARVVDDKSIFGDLIDNQPAVEYARIPVKGDKVTLKAYGNFVDNIDECKFYYKDGDEWNKLGITHLMVYKLDMFVGCRFGLFMYSTKEIGGVAGFSQFRYNTLK